MAKNKIKNLSVIQRWMDSKPGQMFLNADTVTAGTSAKKDDDISRIGILTDYSPSWSCAF